MNEELKSYIEDNSDLIDDDIQKFILRCPDTFQRVLLDVLDEADIAYPKVVKQMVIINNAYIYHPDVLRLILRHNGASLDNPDPVLGFFKGMTSNQIDKTCEEFRDWLKEQPYPWEILDSISKDFSLDS